MEVDLSGWAVATVAGLGVVAIVAGALVFVVASMARATFALLLSFLAVAGLLVAFDLDYLGFVTAVMMTIEMAIMAVFMIMFMMNPAGLMPMTMVHNGVEHAMLMPGMLTDAELARLKAATGTEFDRLFLTFMIKHHEGAIAMVDELFASYGAAQEETVFRFAAK